MAETERHDWVLQTWGYRNPPSQPPTSQRKLSALQPASPPAPVQAGLELTPPPTTPTQCGNDSTPQQPEPVVLKGGTWQTIQTS
jgi:hypothetical protein